MIVELFVALMLQTLGRCVRNIWAGSSCPPPGDLCTRGLCKPPKICRSDGPSYTCTCPDNFTGDDCQHPV